MPRTVLLALPVDSLALEPPPVPMLPMLAPGEAPGIVPPPCSGEGIPPGEDGAVGAVFCSFFELFFVSAIILFLVRLEATLHHRHGFKSLISEAELSAVAVT